MRTSIVLILNLVLMTSRAFADEKLPVLKVDSEIYSNVIITKVSATDLYFISDKGMANVKLKNLDPALQKHFQYDAAKADATEQKHKTGNAQYRLQVISATNQTPGIADVKSEMDDAISRVQEIVNQPVKPLARTPDMKVGTFSPGWFHPGAEKPDFNTVDVRASRQLTAYDQEEYVTSDLNPDVVFLGRELEFNPMTKYFYTDRSVPKKRLTEAEMLEINRLYRIIGHDEEQLARSQNR